MNANLIETHYFRHKIKYDLKDNVYNIKGYIRSCLQYGEVA